MNSQAMAKSHWHSHTQGSVWCGHGRQDLVLWGRHNHCQRQSLRWIGKRNTLALSSSHPPSISHWPAPPEASWLGRLRRLAYRGSLLEKLELASRPWRPRTTGSTHQILCSSCDHYEKLQTNDADHPPPPQYQTTVTSAALWCPIKV